MHYMKQSSILLALLALVLLASTALAADISDLIKKAESGDASSQNELAAKYSAGNGVEKDYEIAFKWYQEAANQGLSAAQSNLAHMYEKGYGVSKDIVKQHMWLTLAGSNGAPMSKYAAKKIAKKMSPEQLKESERMIAEWQKEYGNSK